MFDRGGRFIHGDMGDSRLNALFLEHGYSFLSDKLWFDDFWAARWLYFPFRESMALSDVMIGVVPFFGPWRALGFGPLESYQLWFVTISICNFSTAFLLARLIRINYLGSIACAYLVAFSLPVMAYIGHPQLLPRFPALLCASAIVSLIRARDPVQQYLLAALSALCLAWQFWSSFYPTWFFIFIFSLVLLVLCIFERKWLFHLIGDLKGPLIFAGFLAATLSLPLALKYLNIQKLIGKRSWSEILIYMPNFSGHLSSPSSSFYFDLLKSWSSYPNPNYSERAMFVGFVPWLALFALGLLSSWKSVVSVQGRIVRILFVTLVMLLILPINLGEIHGRSLSLWYFIYRYFPAGSAVRSVGRIVVMTLPLWGVVVGLCLTRLHESGQTWKRLLALSLLVGMIAENTFHADWEFSKVDHYARSSAVLDALLLAQGDSAETICDAFYNDLANGHPHEIQLDAMWVSVLTRIPTLNGYSGGIPPLYRKLGLDEEQIAKREDLMQWVRENQRPEDETKSLCVLRRTTTQGKT